MVIPYHAKNIVTVNILTLCYVRLHENLGPRKDGSSRHASHRIALYHLGLGWQRADYKKKKNIVPWLFPFMLPDRS